MAYLFGLAITRTDADVLHIVPLGTDFSEI